MSSERLRRLRSVLSDGQWHTTADIASRTKSCAVHSDVSDLRRAGIEVECRLLRVDRLSGRRVYAYRMPRMILPVVYESKPNEVHDLPVWFAIATLQNGDAISSQPMMSRREAWLDLRKRVPDNIEIEEYVP